MTDKKESILNTALELFANDGYNATSTSKIARKAGVSEGLIFRHFENKKGLLNAIMEATNKRLDEVLAPVLNEQDPKQVLKKMIALPFETDESEYDFWKLQYKLKWEEEYYNPHKTQPLIDKLSWAFEALGYENPGQEAKFLEKTIEIISTGIIREGLDAQKSFLPFLLDKYNL
jgi:AcrR family transcriptional regulator